MSLSTYSLLETINSPAELRHLSELELPVLANELRAYLIESLNQCGGHFGANLGTVELTIALHYIFNTPDDRLVWDVGHQAYPHKVLTGRRLQLPSIRKSGGLAPFPSRDESRFDAFGVGHSSTSISAALGMAIAAKHKGLAQQTIAVIGDGGLTGGMAFEALNHAGAQDTDLIVILNDNEMSISENVGALTNYLSRILSGKVYSHFREGSKKVLAALPSVKAFAKRTETHFKGMITPGTLFEELGFHYFGPINGHDFNMLLSMLKNLKELKGPRLLHVITTKGKGYEPAEHDPIKYHAVPAKFLEQTSEPSAKTLNYSDVFGQWLCDMAAIDQRLMAITPAMCEGSGMLQFSKKFPQHYIDVGIAEQHSVTLAAGMACEGLKPVVAIYSTFLQRAYDQLIHDVALQNLDVTFALDRSGLVGGDGATHNGSLDLSFLRCIPNLVIMAPSNAQECWDMLYTAYQYAGPAAVRYPRGQVAGNLQTGSMQVLEIAKAQVLRTGSHIAILAFGSMVQPAIEVAEQLNATLINMRFIKPLDEGLILQLTKDHKLFVTIEENSIKGGAGSAVAECLAQHQQLMPLLQLGLPDRFIEHGNPSQLLQQCGLDAASILNSIAQFSAELNNPKNAPEMLIAE
jgi:1-deoxy-D-xylulose-5-phosphate synthase